MKLFEFTKALIFTIPLGIFATLTALLCVISYMNVRRLEDNHKKCFERLTINIKNVTRQFELLQGLTGIMTLQR